MYKRCIRVSFLCAWKQNLNYEFTCICISYRDTLDSCTYVLTKIQSWSKRITLYITDRITLRFTEAICTLRVQLESICTRMRIFELTSVLCRLFVVCFEIILFLCSHWWNWYFITSSILSLIAIFKMGSLIYHNVIIL